MSASSKIEWTHTTWNPVRGCSIVSKGCTNCYAMRQAHRHDHPGGAYEGLTQMSKGGPVWTGEARQVPQQLDAPLHWRKPRRIFVNSMSDLFHEGVDPVFIGSVFGIAAACPQHQFQILTKRPERMREVLQNLAFLDAFESSNDMYTHTPATWPPPNVWLGVSIEDQASADDRIPLLLQAPAAVRWISAEPLLGPVDLWQVPVPGTHGDMCDPRNIHWVVAGGESGPGARPMHPDWARSLRDQCAEALIPFFFKQWGAWREVEAGPHHVEVATNSPAYKVQAARCDGFLSAAGHFVKRFDDARNDVHYRGLERLSKHAAGRLLDGREHNDYPR